MDRLFARYVDLAARRTGLLLSVLLGVALLAVLPILQLDLNTDMAETLPADHPGLQAMHRLAGRQKSSTNLVLLLESPDEAQNRRFAEALRPELEKLIPQVFTEIQWRPETEVPTYYNRQRWLYADKQDLSAAKTLLDRVVARRRSPLLVDLEGDAEAELRALRQRLESRLPAPKAADYFVGQEKDTHYLGVMMWRRGDGLATRGDLETLASAQEVVGRVNPARFHPRMKAQFTGHIAMAIDEHNAVRDDLTMATGVCATLVVLVIYLYFRRPALLLVIGAPAVMGLLLSLALARYTLHSLNANTGFLISIILGNGINSPIILLARYGEERRRGQDVAGALRAAMSATLLATGTAMAAASISYGCLLLTSFRGFSQFGLVGGAGMLLVWLMTFILVPPLCILGERFRPGLLTPRPNLWRRPFAWLGAASVRHPFALALCAAVAVILAVMPVRRYLKDPLEWQLDNLNTAETESQRKWSKMYELGMGNVGAGYIGTDGVLLVDRAEQADPVADAMIRQDQALGEDRILAAVRTISSMLPREQDDKLQILSRIRQTIDKNREVMGDEEWREAQAWRPPDGLRRLQVDDLPRRLIDMFTEVDGTRGRLIGIDGDPRRFRYPGWHGKDIIRLARSMSVTTLGKTWTAASASTVFAGILEILRSDSPRVTIASVFGVLLLCLCVFGGRGSLPVLVSLLVGMVWLLGLLAWFKLKLNFVNFVALPITLGVGTDYAANIWARLRREGVASMGAVIADTGSAVALCSMTTIIGYSSLLLASNRALKSFGLVADLGEVTCLLAALLVLPAVVKLIRRGRA